MSEIQMWGLWLRLRAIQAVQDRKHDERGDIVQTVVITALFAAAAIAICAIIIKKFTDKANSIPTG